MLRALVASVVLAAGIDEGRSIGEERQMPSHYEPMAVAKYVPVPHQSTNNYEVIFIDEGQPDFFAERYGACARSGVGLSWAKLHSSASDKGTWTKPRALRVTSSHGQQGQLDSLCWGLPGIHKYCFNPGVLTDAKGGNPDFPNADVSSELPLGSFTGDLVRLNGGLSGPLGFLESLSNFKDCPEAGARSEGGEYRHTPLRGRVFPEIKLALAGYRFIDIIVGILLYLIVAGVGFLAAGWITKPRR